MKFFGKADRDKDGKIKSDYPAWYNEQHVDDLKESIDQQERALENDAVPSDRRSQFRERLKREKERLDDIEGSRPQFNDKEKDEICNLRKDLGIRISVAMYKTSDMQRGLANAHEEAKRMTEPCIKITSERENEVAEACGIKVKDGKVTRTEAEKMWKIISKGLGEISNTESLRNPK